VTGSVAVNPTAKMIANTPAQIPYLIGASWPRTSAKTLIIAFLAEGQPAERRSPRRLVLQASRHAAAALCATRG